MPRPRKPASPFRYFNSSPEVIRLFAADIRRQRVNRMRSFRHWRWHLDEMYVKFNGEMVYLWRAVDQEGEILESFITKSPR